jgi:hypothetical protein
MFTNVVKDTLILANSIILKNSSNSKEGCLNIQSKPFSQEFNNPLFAHNNYLTTKCIMIWTFSMEKSSEWKMKTFKQLTLPARIFSSS